MKQIICHKEYIFGPWMMARLPGGGMWLPGRGSIIGLIEDGKPIAACLFEAFNGASVLIHIAAEGKRWMTREYLWFVFFYPFEQLSVKKILAPVESTNLDGVKFVEHIGFTLEATLQNAAPNGDLLIFSITKEQCRWLDLKGRYRGNPTNTEQNSSSQHQGLRAVEPV